MTTRWVIDGNNVFGSRPDGWWNDRSAAMGRLAQTVAEWCRTHADEVELVFDPPLPDAVAQLAGGNLAISEAPRRGRDAADHHIVELTQQWLGREPTVPIIVVPIIVVTSDRGLRARLAPEVSVRGSGSFRETIGY